MARRFAAAFLVALIAGCSEKTEQVAYFVPGQVIAGGYPAWALISEIPTELQVAAKTAPSGNAGSTGESATGEPAAAPSANGTVLAQSMEKERSLAITETSESDAAAADASQTAGGDPMEGAPADGVETFDSNPPFCYIRVAVYRIESDSIDRVEQHFGYLRPGVIHAKHGECLYAALQEIGGVERLSEMHFRVNERSAAVMTQDDVDEPWWRSHFYAVKPVSIEQEGCNIALASQGIDWVNGRDMSRAQWYFGAETRMAVRDWVAAYATIRGDDFRILILAQLEGVNRGE